MSPVEIELFTDPACPFIRVRTMVGGLLDDSALIDGAARDAEIDPAELAAWVGDSDVVAALEADIAAARDPVPSARALNHKLGGPDGERRYTAPTYLIGGIVVPEVGRFEAAGADGYWTLPRD